MNVFPRRYRLLCLLCVLTPFLQARAAENGSKISISEFMALNENGLKDEDDDRSGWIEIYNGTSGTLNLSGWSLTTSQTNLVQWRLPNVWLLPEKYLLVFASGKNRATNNLHLHTNFRLNPAGGGYLALVDRGTNIVSEFAQYPKQSPNVSYGRVPGDSSVVGPFVHPTPGKINSTDGPGFVGEVRFSPSGGTFNGSFQVELQCASSNAVIHYTTDGTLPNSRSPVYRRPLPVTKNLRLRARAYGDNLFPGPPRTQSYLLLHTNLNSFVSKLPVLLIETIGHSPEEYSPDAVAQLTFFEPRDGRTSLTNPPAVTVRAGYHIRGSSTLDMPKSSFVLHLLNEFNQEQHRPLLGLPADSDWVLYAPNRFEPVLIHNPFIHQLSRDLGRYSPRTRFVEVYAVRRAGPVSHRDYQGIYVLEEKIKIGHHRVDIDRLGPADLAEPEVTGGYLLKIDRLGPSESGFWTRDASIVYVEPKERVISLPERAPQREFLNNYFKAFEGALHGPNWKDPATGYRAYIDVDAWIDYHVLEVLSGNVDALVYSTYFYKPRNGKLVFGPHWDFDRALGSTDGRDDNPRRWNTGHFFGGPWYAQLFRDPDFWQAWVDRWQDLREKQFSLAYLNGLIDHLADEVREAQPREAARWDNFSRGGNYQSEVDWMKEWLSNRVTFIDEQLVAKPKLNLPSTAAEKATVTFNVPDGATVYYTLNGSDPRLPQGGISTNALIYANAFELPAGAQLCARARNPAKRQIGGPRNSTPWSGPVRTDSKAGQPEP